MQTSTLPSSLPPQLLQALNELDVLSGGPAGDSGDDFWLRLATQLEQFEEVAAVLPEDMDVDHLAAWLAVGLGGEGLPEDGKDLPLPPGLVLAEPLRAGIQGQVPDGLTPGDARARAETGAVSVAMDKVAMHLRDGWESGLLRVRAGHGTPELGPGAGLPPLDLDAQGAYRMASPLAAAMLDITGRSWSSAPFPTASGIAELAGLSARTTETVAQPSAVPAAAMAMVESPSGPQAGSANPLAPRLFNLDVPVQQQGWDRAFGHGIRWMVNQNVQLAEIRLSPPNLGPLEVRLQVDGDRTHLNIVAPHATTREAVEAALPRLREMFAESGLNLGDVNVRQDNTGRGGSEAEDRSGADAARAADGEDRSEVDRHASATVHVGRGLVDFYA